MKTPLICITFVSFCLLGSGCVAVKVADTAASATLGAAVGVTKVAVKGTTAVAQAVIPDSDKKKKKK